ncbi:MAG: PepSY domain-containing protein [Thalassotalea sp.]
MKVLRIVFVFLLLVPLAHAETLLAKNTLSFQLAQSPKTQFKTAMFAQQLAVQSSHQAGQTVKRQYGGKVLKVSKKGKNGNITYLVKLLKDDGKIISVLVDASSGQILRR